jgi:hypothetical protein
MPFSVFWRAMRCCFFTSYKTRFECVPLWSQPTWASQCDRFQLRSIFSLFVQCSLFWAGSLWVFPLPCFSPHASLHVYHGLSRWSWEPYLARQPWPRYFCCTTTGTSICRPIWRRRSLRMLTQLWFPVLLFLCTEPCCVEKSELRNPRHFGETRDTLPDVVSRGRAWVSKDSSWVVRPVESKDVSKGKMPSATSGGEQRFQGFQTCRRT